jgi:hypothetical protein
MVKTTLSSAAILLTAATTGWAQESDGAIAERAPILEALPDVAKEKLPPITDFVGGQAPGQLLATDLLGLTVHAGGTAIGTIDNVLMAESGRPLFVVVDVGEYLKAEKRIAFAFESLGYQGKSDDIRLVASIDPATIGEAPAFISLADEMAQNDGQSITEGEAEPKSVDPQAPSN